jgi:hypothetical protein
MPPDPMTEPEFRTLLQFWSERCDGSALPTRRMLDPVTLYPLLPLLALVEVVEDGADFRVRLAGSEVEDRHGTSLRGRSLDEIRKKVDGEDTTDQWALATETRRPYYRRGPVRFPNEQHFDYARLILPIAADGQDRETPMFLLAGTMMQPTTRGHFERGGTVAFQLDGEMVRSILS